MRISDWSSDVCSSDLARCAPTMRMVAATIALEKPEISISLPNTAPSRNTGKYSFRKPTILSMNRPVNIGATSDGSVSSTAPSRSEEHTTELQSLMRISYAVFCLEKKNNYKIKRINLTELQGNHINSNH